MAKNLITEYTSAAALEQHRKSVETAIERSQTALREADPRLLCVPIRVDDLQILFGHIEALQADVFDAQKAALEDAIATIEFIGEQLRNYDWTRCVATLRDIISTAEDERNQERMNGMRTRRRRR